MSLFFIALPQTDCEQTVNLHGPPFSYTGLNVVRAWYLLVLGNQQSPFRDCLTTFYYRDNRERCR